MIKLSSNSRVRHTKDCAFQKIVGKMVVVYPRERALHRLNEIGTSIWESIGSGCKFSEIVDFVVSEYEIDRTIAEKDLREFLSQLNEKKLILIED